MPFAMNQGIPFDEANVFYRAPAMPGVYGIFRDGQWIYVGESNSIQRRLNEHLGDLLHNMHRYGPTHFVYELCDNRITRQNQLILECAPCCNQMFG